MCASVSRSDGDSPAAQSYSWLQPNPMVTQVPASVVAAMNAKAPRASPDGENVRQFVNQASFRSTPGTTLTTQQSGAASGPSQQEQGRRLAEVTPAGPPADMYDKVRNRAHDAWDCCEAIPTFSWSVIRLRMLCC